MTSQVEHFLGNYLVVFRSMIENITNKSSRLHREIHTFSTTIKDFLSNGLRHGAINALRMREGDEISAR